MVDRFGRKKLLMASCATTSASITSLGVYFYLNDTGLEIFAGNIIFKSQINFPNSIRPDLVQKLNWLPLASLIVYLYGNNIGGHSLNDVGTFFGSLDPSQLLQAILTQAMTMFCLCY